MARRKGKGLKKSARCYCGSGSFRTQQRYVKYMCLRCGKILLKDRDGVLTLERIAHTFSIPKNSFIKKSSRFKRFAGFIKEVFSKLLFWK